MQPQFELKEQPITETPLLVFQCTLQGGAVERWSTHRVRVDGEVYEPRVLHHNVFEIQAASEQGVDAIPRVSLVLANADSHFSQIERSIGWKGARLQAAFLFYDLRNDEAATASEVLFQGICNPPDEVREATIRLSAINRMSLQRLLLPQVRIQRRCPWEFPANQAQRQEAIDGGAAGRYSRFYRCGYSAGEPGGLGNPDGGSPFADCGFTRADCEARGMFSHFGGIEFVPSAIAVRTYGDKSWHTSAIAVSEARYNDFVPMIYGTAWYTPPVVFARNDGNLTRMEVLLGMGEMQGVLKVLVNGVEIPSGQAGKDMTGTGWYNAPTLGTRAGACNPDFTDGTGNPAGDPYGSMAYLSAVVPNRINDGTKLPQVRVLAEGLKLSIYTTAGLPDGERFTCNPAWILLDVLRRAGWSLSEIDLPSFSAAAAYCDESIEGVDPYGAAISHPRFQCNLVLQNRKSAGDIVRGVRNGSRLALSYGAQGELQLRVESSVAVESPTKPDWSNSTERLNGGWPSYEFGDGTNGFSGILRRENGEPSVRVFSRSLADTPNRFGVEFQDALNEYQQDGMSLVDPDDIERSGQEIATTLAALGLPNFHQAARILKLSLDKSIRGNTYIEFDSSVRALGVRPGDLITVTYLKEGFDRQPFRVLKIAPGINHRVITITAQIHDDSWYQDESQTFPGGRRQPAASIGLPRPLVGSVVGPGGDIQFGVEEVSGGGVSGSAEVDLSVSFAPPTTTVEAGPGIPLLSLAPEIGTNGSLDRNQTLYYAVAGQDTSGKESGLSFIVRAQISQPGSSVTISGLSFAPGTATFKAYRGASPAELLCIAADEPLADRFTDTGLEPHLEAPPDQNFHHANFYWRVELQPETSVTTHSATSVGNGSLQMAANRYRGMTVRITRGMGSGQERIIAANDAATLTLANRWEIEPDASSFFVVAEGSWQFGALSAASPVRFAVPDRGGETLQICGRAANVNDIECALEISPVTRWQIGGSGTFDRDVPATPSFALSQGQRSGSVDLCAVAFEDLTNTQSISAGTLTVYYWNELQPPPLTTLAGTITATDTLLDLSVSGTAAAGSILQVDGEVMRVEEVLNAGMRYRVTRGALSSDAAAHLAQSTVWQLFSNTLIAPFPPGFFGSPYSGSWSFPVALPDARIAGAELFMTNRCGNSPTRAICLTQSADQGLRTFLGGQYSIQAEGVLAIDQSVAPPLVVDSTHAVRDVFGVLGRAADATVEVRIDVDDEPYCTLTFDPGATVSDSVSGRDLAPLPSGSRLTAAILSVGQSYPGADLTVLIRL